MAKQEFLIFHFGLSSPSFVLVRDPLGTPVALRLTPWLGAGLWEKRQELFDAVTADVRMSGPLG